jgi:hypothetical protein
LILDYLEAKKEISRLERFYIGQESERNTLQNILDEQNASLILLETKKNNTRKGQIFLRQKASDTRVKALASIEDILTSAVQRIYGVDYRFIFEMKEVTTKEDDFTGLYTVLPSIEKTINGKKVIRPIKGSNGGGLQEIISFLLRIAFGTYNEYNGIYVFDEALAAVSKDGVMKNLLSFIKSLIKESDLQILLVTHSAELFSQISDLNYLTYKEDGIGKMRAVDREDILEMQNFDVNDTTVEIP